MNELVVYFLKVNVAIALFYLFYRLFFSNDTFWRTRRIYLLFSILTSFAYPFLSIENWLQSQEPVQVFVANYSMLQDYTITATPIENSISLSDILWGVYAFIVSVLFVRLLIQLFSIGSIRLNAEKIDFHGLKIRSIEKEITPFSFFGDIYLNPALHSESEVKQILAHELTHVKQFHSVDVIIAEIVTIVMWINPAAWLLKREIRQNLEFLADNKVIESGFDVKNYQYHLLQLSYQVPDYKLTNKFNISPLKKRITMMNQPKTSKTGILKYLLIAPLALALVVSSNAETLLTSAQKKMNESVTQQEITPVFDAKKSDHDKEIAMVDIKKQNETNSDEDPIFEMVENMPVFPGDESALMNFLKENIKYPVEAQAKGIQGRVVCGFIVKKNGIVDSVKVLRSVHSSLDAEAVRVIKAMPNWKPGTQRGKNVNVRFTLPINFALDNKKNKAESLGNEDVTFMVVETMPVFPGGDGALMKFLRENIKYPSEAQKMGIQGRIICQFVIEKDGSISDVTVVRSVNEHLDAEAVRVIKAMPNWTPGEQRGVKVRVKYTLPINFNLDGKSEKATTSRTLVKNMLVIVNDKVKEPGFDLQSIAPNTIEKVEVLNAYTDDEKNELIKKYGENAKNGVLIVKLK